MNYKMGDFYLLSLINFKVNVSNTRGTYLFYIKHTSLNYIPT